MFGDVELLQSDPAWQGLLWFPEYFHGDTGAGLGAMHQTGWTAEVINLLLDPPRDAAGLTGCRVRRAGCRVHPLCRMHVPA